MRRRRGGIGDHEEWDSTPLEIELEDEEGDRVASESGTADGAGPSATRTRAARRRRIHQVIGAAGVVAILAIAAAGAGHGGSHSGSTPPSRFYIDDSAAVRITYLNSYLVSAAQRRLEVELNITPLQSQPIKITEISVSEGGVSVAPVGISDTLDVPAAGQNVLLVWTVQDCARVPMDESMAYVEVITMSAGGFVMDRFTILGDRYAADISRLLHAICGPGLPAGTAPADPNGTSPATPRATGPLGTVS
jgi:hypothetical protein